jgi:hypothetical protein
MSHNDESRSGSAGTAANSLLPQVTLTWPARFQLAVAFEATREVFERASGQQPEMTPCGLRLRWESPPK